MMLFTQMTRMDADGDLQTDGVEQQLPAIMIPHAV